VQLLLEACVGSIAHAFKFKNLIVTGGCFFNVKLNKMLLDQVEGQLCVHPLAGDQGNALGLYFRDHPEFVFPETLCWGHRTLRLDGEVGGIEMYHHEDELWERAREELDDEGIVNVVRSAMEFGPRALCRTSTLAMPTSLNVEKINTMNDRNTIMPMAPVVSERFYRRNFKGVDRVRRSERYMICAMEYDRISPQWLGAANRYEEDRTYHTGRPQVVYQHEDPQLYDLLEDMGGILINTSFNYHGHPICHGMKEVVETHRLNTLRGGHYRTLVLEN
jgi:predicted NodU family carbamoyl transferase